MEHVPPIWYKAFESIANTPSNLMTVLYASVLLVVSLIIIRKRRISRQKRFADTVIANTDLRNTMNQLKNIGHQVNELIKAYMGKVKEKEEEYVQKIEVLARIDKKIMQAKAIEKDLPNIRLKWIATGGLCGFITATVILYAYYYFFVQM